MKVKNLLKKVGSVMTTAALLATLGTTAFADGDGTVGVGGDGISITKVETVQHENSTDVYDVTVTYKTTKKNVTGMTLLAYRANTNDNTPGDMKLDPDAQKNAYDDSKYGEDENSPKKMQIVGIEQSAAVDGTSDNKTGSFTFTVTTNSTSNGAYYIEKGKKALVAVSGDQCKPAYALFGVNATATSASCNLGTVQINANESIDNALNDWMESNKENITVEFFNNGKDLGIDTVKLKDVDFSSVNSWTKDSSGAYKATVTLPKEQISDVVDINSDSIPLYLTATVEIQAVPGTVTKLAGQTVTTSGSELSAELTVSKKDLGETPGIPALTDLLNTKFKTATISDGGNPALEDRINATFALESPGTTYDGNEYRYIATVGGDDEASLKGEKGEVKLNAKATIKVKVTLSEDSITVNGIVDKGHNSITAIDSVTIPSGTTEETAIIDAVKAELDKKEYKLAYKKNNSEDLSYASIPVDNTVNVVYSSTSVVPDTNDTTKGTVTFNIGSIEGISTTYSFTVPYTTAPAFTYGDVNNDGMIDGDDIAQIVTHIKKEAKGETFLFEDFNTKEKIPEMYGDVTGDFKNPEVGLTIDGDDIAQIVTHIKKEAKGELYTFPAEKE